MSLSVCPSVASPFTSFGLCSLLFPYKLKLEFYSSVVGGNAFLKQAQEVT